jgi:hypothetical protein
MKLEIVDKDMTPIQDDIDDSDERLMILRLLQSFW